ncbi:MAG TPA: enoyl-CoA hydratase-related protein, partial [Longimicrobium sp.]
RLGIVNTVLDAGSRDEFLEQVLAYARQFTRPGKATFAVGNIKRSCQSGAELPLEQGLALERELQALLFNSQDAKEGLNAYVEKRAPQFIGK